MNIMTIPESFLKSKGVKNPKIVIYGTMAVVAGVVVFMVVRAIKRKADSRWDSGTTQSRLEEDLSKLSTADTTITKGDAILISQNLLNAMDQWGTDEEAIIDNLNKCKTKGDLNLIIQTFGIKPYDGLGLADTFLSRNIGAVMKNLNGWLRQELGGASLRKVKEIYNNLDVSF